MRLLKRNLEPFEYRAYSGKEETITDNGLHTGHFDVTYDAPIRYMGNFSEARGYASQKMFGRDANYTHVLIVDDPKAPMTENGLIDYKEDNYVITAVRASTNYLALALRKRTKNTTDPVELVPYGN